MEYQRVKNALRDYIQLLEAVYDNHTDEVNEIKQLIQDLEDTERERYASALSD